MCRWHGVRAGLCVCATDAVYPQGLQAAGHNISVQSIIQLKVSAPDRPPAPSCLCAVSTGSTEIAASYETVIDKNSYQSLKLPKVS